MKHTDILIHLAVKYGLKSYLEIGVQNPNNNLAHIPCDTKVGVDVEPFTHPSAQTFVGTSDEFFDCECSKAMTFDLIFIDGLHHAVQVKKDFENAVKRLNKGGFIVIHDCNPTKEEITKVPRETKEWTGDVFRFAATIKAIPGITINTYEDDYGVAIIQVDRDQYKNPNQKFVSWSTFDKNRANLLNLITVEQFKEIY